MVLFAHGFLQPPTNYASTMKMLAVEHNAIVIAPNTSYFDIANRSKKVGGAGEMPGRVTKMQARPAPPSPSSVCFSHLLPLSASPSPPSFPLHLILRNSFSQGSTSPTVFHFECWTQWSTAEMLDPIVHGGNAGPNGPRRNTFAQLPPASFPLTT